MVPFISPISHILSILPAGRHDVSLKNCDGLRNVAALCHRFSATPPIFPRSTSVKARSHRSPKIVPHLLDDSTILWTWLTATLVVKFAGKYGIMCYHVLFFLWKQLNVLLKLPILIFLLLQQNILYIFQAIKLASSSFEKKCKNE